jgi:NlpC/P60 family putative phage cell wall peptidase
VKLLRAAIVAEAYSWVGTPYHHQAMLRGIGVDCAMLPIGVYRAFGFLTDFDPRPYPVEWHLHHDDERFIKALETVGARRVDQPQPGDIAMFKYGRTASHGSIVVTPGAEGVHMKFIHSYIGRGCVESELFEDDYASRLHSYWSIL